MSNITVRFVSRAVTVRFPACPVSLETFTALMGLFAETLDGYENSEAAFAALGDKKFYLAGQGNTEAARGTLMLTYPT